MIYSSHKTTICYSCYKEKLLSQCLFAPNVFVNMLIETAWYNTCDFTCCVLSNFLLVSEKPATVESWFFSHLDMDDRLSVWATVCSINLKLKIVYILQDMCPKWWCVSHIQNQHGSRPLYWPCQCLLDGKCFPHQNVCYICLWCT